MNKEVAKAFGLDKYKDSFSQMNWEERIQARDRICLLISSLIIEALVKGIDVEDLSHAIAFPFGRKDWPGKEEGSYVGMEIARSAISYTQYVMQSSILGNEKAK